jgi:SulP family sulfate permease
MTKTKHNPNKELFSQGVGNIVSPLFFGIPATGAIARTAANIRCGGQTHLAGLVHSLTLAMIVLFFSNLLTLIPVCSLAGILLVVSFYMSDLPHFIKNLKCSKVQGAVMLVTFLTTLLYNLLWGIALGLILHYAVIAVKKVKLNS